MPLESGLLLHGRYRIQRLHKIASESAVYLASDTARARPVAIKESLIADVLGQRQLAHEADILAHLRHPNIPRGLDCFVDDVGEFLVMDFVFGEDLSEWIAHTSPGLRPLRRTLGGVFDALAYLHSCRPPIIHRDIEPSNIILTDRQVTCLVDFGRAKRFEPPNLPGFAAALAGLGLIDEYEFVVQARIVGPGPTLIAGLSKSIDLRLVGRLEFASGAVAMRYEPTR